jgi:hypothetical protein
MSWRPDLLFDRRRPVVTQEASGDDLLCPDRTLPSGGYDELLAVPRDRPRDPELWGKRARGAPTEIREGCCACGCDTLCAIRLYQSGVLPGGPRDASRALMRTCARPENRSSPLTILDWVNLFALPSTRKRRRRTRRHAPNNGARDRLAVGMLVGPVPGATEDGVLPADGGGDRHLVQGKRLSEPSGRWQKGVAA